MIDYLEFSFNPKTEAFLNKLGEKFIFTAGNIASYSTSSMIGCKIFSSLPEADGFTYRPARKRIFISHKQKEQQYLKELACGLDYMWWLEKSSTTEKQIEAWIVHGQKTPLLPFSFKWYKKYTLLAEGHYTQIWAHHNWNMMLPFIGEGDQINPMHIMNTEYDEQDPNTDPGSPQSIDSTHRDF